MVKTLEVGTADRETLLAEYDRLTDAGIDMAGAYRTEHWPGGWVCVYRFDLRDGRPYIVPGTEHLDTPQVALAVATWHRVAS